MTSGKNGHIFITQLTQEEVSFFLLNKFGFAQTFLYQVKLLRLYNNHIFVLNFVASWTLAWELHSKDPTLIMKKAVYRAIGINLQRHSLMHRVHLFRGKEVPKEILENVTNQIRQLRPVPERLDKMDPDLVRNFPKIMDYPEEYVPKKISQKKVE